ncbi:MAG: response regulator [Gammaproteobacteria bacterium]|nr:response regulator [Gammaproteobacteria bacterium]
MDHPAITALVVDDSTSFRQYLSNILRVELGFDSIIEATSADEAVELIDSNKHNIGWIFSDWEMPGMTGGELLSHVRARSDMINVPFIMLTDREDMQARSIAMQEGVTDFITKPFETEDLVSKVLRLLGMMEIRRSPRFHLDARCRLDIGFDDFQQYAADLINISQNGCLIRTSRFYADTAHVLDIGTIYIQPVSGGDEIVTNIEIVRIERDNKVKDHVLVALDFQETDELNFKRLDKLISASVIRQKTMQH